MDNTDSGMSLLADSDFVLGVVCVLLISAGVIAMRLLKPESPLAPYVLQILGLTFILPVVVLVTRILEVDAQAVMGLLGTIVGYIFGTSQVATRRTNGAGRSEDQVAGAKPE